MTTLAICFIATVTLALSHQMCEDRYVRKIIVSTCGILAGILLVLILLHALMVLP